MEKIDYSVPLTNEESEEDKIANAFLESFRKRLEASLLASDVYEYTSKKDNKEYTSRKRIFNEIYDGIKVILEEYEHERYN